MHLVKRNKIRGKQSPTHQGKSSVAGSAFILTLILISWLSSANQVEAVKCHLCLFHLAHCTNPLDCYNQPDTCSNTNFSPISSEVVECEFGCEQYVITDATGSVVVWRRGCASERSPKSSYICFSRNIYFLRHEQCWCHQDHCNSASSIETRASLALKVFTSISFAATCLVYLMGISTN